MGFRSGSEPLACRRDTRGEKESEEEEESESVCVRQSASLSESETVVLSCGACWERRGRGGGYSLLALLDHV